MALFFSGAVTSSPIKRRLRGNDSCQSLDQSLLSPDSSYVCYPSVDGDAPSCCRRSPRLLTNGYYAVTEDSFSWDGDGNVSLTPCETNVSYKENLVRVFRRRRRPRSSLARLLSDVTESCQTWLEDTVFRGVFSAGQNKDRERDADLDREEEPGRDWATGSGSSSRVLSSAPPPLAESSWSVEGATQLEDRPSFTYDPTEIPPPPDKVAPPPKQLIQEEICSEICQSKEQFTQTLGGLAEVPPPSGFYTNTCCCQTPPPGQTGSGFWMKTLLLLTLMIFLSSALFSRFWFWSAAAGSSALVLITTGMFLTKSGPMGEWRRAKTEDITPGNE